MTIEEKLLKDLGRTTDPCLAVWLLKDGTYVNGSKEGHQRDVDHHEIGQYFKPSKFAEPGSSYIYMRKFMRRGNIRIGYGNGYAFAEMAVPPTEAQARTLLRDYGQLQHWGDDVCIERRSGRNERVLMDVPAFRAYLHHYCHSFVA